MLAHYLEIGCFVMAYRGRAVPPASPNLWILSEVTAPASTVVLTYDIVYITSVDAIGARRACASARGAVKTPAGNRGVPLSHVRAVEYGREDADVDSK